MDVSKKNMDILFTREDNNQNNKMISFCNDLWIDL